MKHWLLAAAAFSLAACVAAPTRTVPSPREQSDEIRATPFADYHQHLVSAAFAPLAKLPERDAKALLAELDAAGIERAVILSVAYSFADERKQLADPDALTRKENDWTSAQVLSGKGRLLGFCSANPLRDAALVEIERCLTLPGMRGIKLHIGNSGLNFRNAEHLARLAAWFALAQQRRVPLLVHMRPRGGSDFGATDVPIFLEKLVALAPGVPVIVAHLGATSPGYVAQNDEVMAAFAAAAARGAAEMRNIYFDVAANVPEHSTPQSGRLIAARMRQLGVQRFLYGSDLSAAGGTIGAAWQLFRTRVALSDAEFAQIANNRLLFDH